MFGRSCHLSWTNANVAQCFVPGSSTRRSRRTVLGQSRRYAAKELARLPTLGLSPSSPVPAAPKMNSPRDPPASCVCSRKSRLCRHSPPNLMVWFPCSLVSVAATLYVFSDRSHGRLPANPTTGLAYPLLIVMDDRPDVHASMFAPGIPSSVLVVSPAPSESATLW